MPRLVLAFFALAFCSCVSYVAPAPGSDYGAPPTKAIRKPIARYFGEVLKDPGAAKYRFGTPRKAYAHRSGVPEVAFQGWGIPVEVNARNTFGGYGGFEMFFALVRDGELRSVVSKDDGYSVVLSDEDGARIDLWKLEFEAKKERDERLQQLSLQ